MTGHLTLRAIGDLDNPAFGDERSRVVWLESYAIGWQVLTFGSWLFATAMIWSGGRSLMGWSTGALVLPGLASILGLAYVRSQGLEPPGVREAARSPRVWVLVLVVVVWLVGAIRAAGDLPTRTGLTVGVVVGLALGILAAIIGERRARAREAAIVDERFDD